MTVDERFNFICKFALTMDATTLSGRPATGDGYECETCAAIVTKVEKHNQWHNDRGE